MTSNTRHHSCLTALIVLLGATFASGHARAALSEPSRLPTLDEINAEAWMIEQFEKTDYLTWKRKYVNALRALTAGQIDSFQDQLLKLEQDESRLKSSSKSQRMALMYSWATESGINVSPERFLEAIEAYEETSQGVRGVHGEKIEAPKNRPEWQRVLANYAYLNRDLESLKVLAKVPNLPDLTRAYISYLLADLDGSPAALNVTKTQLESAIDQAIERVTEMETDQDLGVAALWLGRVHNMLAIASAANEEKAENLYLAQQYAKVARSNLELLEVPVLFGRAMALTSEIDDRLAGIQTADNDRGQRRKKELEERSARAHELAIQYL